MTGRPTHRRADECKVVHVGRQYAAVQPDPILTDRQPLADVWRQEWELHFESGAVHDDVGGQLDSVLQQYLVPLEPKEAACDAAPEAACPAGTVWIQ